MERRKRVALIEGVTCMLCGEHLPAGMTAYETRDTGNNILIGYSHYGKCKGVVRAESQQRLIDYSKKSLNDLLDIVRYGKQNEFADASTEIRRRVIGAVR